MAKEWPDSDQSARRMRPTSPENKDRIAQLILEADLLASDGRLEEARSRLSAALASLPIGDRRRSVVRYRLGIVELEAGEYEAALDHLAEARRAYERSGLMDRVRACRWGKAIAKIGLGDWEGALQEFESLREEYWSMGQVELAEWITRLSESLCESIPTPRVRRIARAKPIGTNDLAEDAVLKRLMDRLASMERLER